MDSWQLVNTRLSRSANKEPAKDPSKDPSKDSSKDLSKDPPCTTARRLGHTITTPSYSDSH